MRTIEKHKEIVNYEAYETQRLWAKGVFSVIPSETGNRRLENLSDVLRLNYQEELRLKPSSYF